MSPSTDPDPDIDPRLRAALRHAPDGDAAPPPLLDERIGAAARDAVSARAKPTTDRWWKRPYETLLRPPARGDGLRDAGAGHRNRRDVARPGAGAGDAGRCTNRSAVARKCWGHRICASAQSRRGCTGRAGRTGRRAPAGSEHRRCAGRAQSGRPRGPAPRLSIRSRAPGAAH